ncbi:MAG: ATP-dependent Clp protease ATP-binding subunit ClpA, partial [Deltaproteobacteria bacterium]
MITRELENTFNMAVREAERRRHDLVCLEHILFAMLQEVRASEILRSCGANIESLRRDLEDFLTSMQSVPQGNKLELEQTMAVTRVLRRAAIHVQSAGKKEIDAGDVLAAMY